MVRIVRAHTPIRRLVLRHTRELLRGYFGIGMLTTRIAERSVDDRFVEMTGAERALYEAVEEYARAPGTRREPPSARRWGSR